MKSRVVLGYSGFSLRLTHTRCALSPSHTAQFLQKSFYSDNLSFPRTFQTAVGSWSEHVGQIQPKHYHLVYTCKVSFFSGLKQRERIHISYNGGGDLSLYWGLRQGSTLCSPTHAEHTYTHSHNQPTVQCVFLDYTYIADNAYLKITEHIHIQYINSLILICMCFFLDIYFF